MQHKILYNYKKPYETKTLKVDSIHTLKIRKFGNPKGIPVIFLHGGPGAPTEDYFSCYFDKRYYNIILFDQRGCGTSKPLGELRNNNTQELIEDIEKIRIECKFKKIILYGGSWGASLAILYIMKYPNNIISFIIRSICLLKDGVFTENYKNMYTDKWEKFLSLGYPDSISKTISKYFNKIKENDKKYIENWANWELPCLTVLPTENKSKMSYKKKYLYCLIESYYFKNNFFLPENYILNNLKKIPNIFGYIVHGRLDVICNPKDSYTLSKSIKKSKMIFIDSTGHNGEEMTKTLVECTKKLIKIYFKSRKKYYFE
jgi:proline iminopeptidase